MKYKNYYNFELGNRDIYSHNDILGMTVQDLFDNELPLSYQYNTIGIPKDDELISSPNTHQYTNANGKLRWRSSSKTTEELLEEERQRRAEQEAQTANVQSQLAGFGQTSSPVVSAPKPTVESPMIESEPLIDNKTMSDFVVLAKDKWQNRNNNQTLSAETLPSSPKENIFQRIDKGIKETVDSFGDPKELREYKKMMRDMEQATRDMRANQVSFEDLVNMPTPTAEPLESFAPIQKDLGLGYPKSITMPGINPNSKIQLSTVEPEKTSLLQRILKKEPLQGGITGGAAQIDRTQENPLMKHNNDDFFDIERMYEKNGNMKINADMNKERPDAKLFMDIALTHPKNVPSCKDYYFLSSKHNSEFNEAFKLEGNKQIPEGYDGFKFSEDSPTAQRLNSSTEFKSQVFSPKNFDSKTGQFKSDKLEIELKDDKNLGYSFGHMTVLNPKITDDGYVVGWGYDQYNYEWINL